VAHGPGLRPTELAHLPRKHGEVQLSILIFECPETSAVIAADSQGVRPDYADTAAP